MARTAVPYQNWTADSNLSEAASGSLGTTIDSTLVTAGVVIDDADPSRSVIRVLNTSGGARDVIVRAGANPPAWRAGQGDLTIEVAAGQHVWIPPLTEARYMQAGSKIHIDFESGFTGRITPFKLARNI